ncbi:hypothetical protein L596_012094 [Steinernema carpocapsae]|uniref:RING-type domain-containing protein n=1 Tax=Steinernema carpocapsae TaxID=34508 RepID=A0A4U5NWD5_STECR|nr:hypothetical protein L596_012094 [Steinernema carpocapsae]
MSFERFNCGICLDFLSACKLTLATNCGHVFHKQCLEQSLAINPKCPSCRQAFSKARKVILPAARSEKHELQAELVEAHQRLEELLKENEDLKAKKTPSATLIRNEDGEYIMRSRTFMPSESNFTSHY